MGVTGTLSDERPQPYGQGLPIRASDIRGFDSRHVHCVHLGKDNIPMPDKKTAACMAIIGGFVPQDPATKAAYEDLMRLGLENAVVEAIAHLRAQGFIQ